MLAGRRGEYLKYGNNAKWWNKRPHRERESVYLIGYFPANYSINWISEKRTLLKILSNLICLIIWLQDDGLSLKYGNSAKWWNKRPQRKREHLFNRLFSSQLFHQLNFWKKNFVENIVKFNLFDYLIAGGWMEPEIWQQCEPMKQIATSHLHHLSRRQFPNQSAH